MSNLPLPLKILARIEKLRAKHTALCKAQSWDAAQRVNTAIIASWRQYHAEMEKTSLEQLPLIGHMDFIKWLEIVSFFLGKKGKELSLPDAKALYMQGKTALEVIENHKELV